MSDNKFVTRTFTADQINITDLVSSKIDAVDIWYDLRDKLKAYKKGASASGMMQILKVYFYNTVTDLIFHIICSVFNDINETLVDCGMQLHCRNINKDNRYNKIEVSLRIVSESDHLIKDLDSGLIKYIAIDQLYNKKEWNESLCDCGGRIFERTSKSGNKIITIATCIKCGKTESCES